MSTATDELTELGELIGEVSCTQNDQGCDQPAHWYGYHTPCRAGLFLCDTHVADWKDEVRRMNRDPRALLWTCNRCFGPLAGHLHTEHL